jgi:ubiquitin-conjugating enzyme E2 Q
MKNEIKNEPSPMLEGTEAAITAEQHTEKETETAGTANNTTTRCSSGMARDEGITGSGEEFLDGVEEKKEDEVDGNEDTEFDDDDDEYEYEDEDEQAGFLLDNPEAAAAMLAATDEDGTAASVERNPAVPKRWKQPTQEVINLSNDKTGSKRRLAQDLHRIMNQDVNEAGFSIQPAADDSMDKWTISLFQFDKDSDLAKDMMVLGLQNIELEMSFPDDYPFDPPFVRVTHPRFQRNTGMVIGGALCMELLTKVGRRGGSHRALVVWATFFHEFLGSFHFRMAGIPSTRSRQ